jgi:glutathione S-transferase
VAKYYEEQKEESLKKAADVREHRLPKFFSYFQRNLQHNKELGGEGKYMVGNRLTYADTTVWQILDGLYFAFPKEMEARKKEFPDLLDHFYESVKAEKGIKEYLASDRKFEYSQGIFRHYPELDRQ